MQVILDRATVARLTKAHAWDGEDAVGFWLGCPDGEKLVDRLVLIDPRATTALLAELADAVVDEVDASREVFRAAIDTSRRWAGGAASDVECLEAYRRAETIA